MDARTYGRRNNMTRVTCAKCRRGMWTRYPNVTPYLCAACRCYEPTEAEQRLECWRLREAGTFTENEHGVFVYRPPWSQDRLRQEEGYQPAVAQVVGYDDLHLKMHPFQVSTTLEDYARSDWAVRLKARHAKKRTKGE